MIIQKRSSNGPSANKVVTPKRSVKKSENVNYPPVLDNIYKEKRNCSQTTSGSSFDLQPASVGGGGGGGGN